MEDNKLTICISDFYTYPLFNRESRLPFGGAQVQLYLIAHELAKDPRFNVVFITDDGSEAESTEQYDDIKVHIFPRAKHFGKSSFSIFLYAIARATCLPFLPHFYFLCRLLFFVNADVYIQRTAAVETGALALFCRIFRKRFIYMVAHEIDVSGEFVKKNGLRGKIYKFGLENADAIVCQTQEQFEMLARDLKNRATVIRSGYEIAGTSSLSKDGLLWVGRSEGWKRPELYLKLARRIPDIRCVMIMPPAKSNPELFTSIKEQAAQLPNVEFYDYVSFFEIDTFFSQARAFVNTSDAEGFPNTYIQAAKNRTPLISFSVDPDGFIEKCNIGVSAKGDFESFVNNTKQLLQDDACWKICSENAYKYARENHNIVFTIQKLKALLKGMSCSPARLRQAAMIRGLAKSRKIIIFTLLAILELLALAQVAANINQTPMLPSVVSLALLMAIVATLIPGLIRQIPLFFAMGLSLLQFVNVTLALDVQFSHPYLVALIAHVVTSLTLYVVCARSVGKIVGLVTVALLWYPLFAAVQLSLSHVFLYSSPLLFVFGLLLTKKIASLLLAFLGKSVKKI